MFSYIASMKGSMTSIIHMAATLFATQAPEQEESGTPINAPPPKLNKLPLG